MTKRQDKTFKKRLALKADRLRMTRAIAREVNENFYPINIFNHISGSKISGQNIGGVGHTWVEYKGRCYDAECPHGVRSWLKLPFWQRLRAEVGAKEFDKAVKRATA